MNLAPGFLSYMSFSCWIPWAIRPDVFFFFQKKDTFSYFLDVFFLFVNIAPCLNKNVKTLPLPQITFFIFQTLTESCCQWCMKPYLCWDMGSWFYWSKSVGFRLARPQPMRYGISCEGPIVVLILHRGTSTVRLGNGSTSSSTSGRDNRPFCQHAILAFHMLWLQAWGRCCNCHIWRSRV